MASASAVLSQATSSRISWASCCVGENRGSRASTAESSSVNCATPGSCGQRIPPGVIIATRASRTSRATAAATTGVSTSSAQATITAGPVGVPRLGGGASQLASSSPIRRSTGSGRSDPCDHEIRAAPPAQSATSRAQLSSRPTQCTIIGWPGSDQPAPSSSAMVAFSGPSPPITGGGAARSGVDGDTAASTIRASRLP